MPSSVMGLVALLVWALILCGVLYVVKLVLDMIALPPPIKTIVWLIVGLVALVILLSRLGIAV